MSTDLNLPLHVAHHLFIKTGTAALYNSINTNDCPSSNISMRFIGYYPGIDFGDRSQFGRVIHTKNFIKSYHSAIDNSANFIVGKKDDFEHEGVLELGFGRSIISKLTRDILGMLILIKITLTTDEQIILYCRDSPYLSKLALSLAPGICLVLEVNGLADTEGDTNSLIARIYESIRDRSRKESKLLIAVSQEIKDELQNRYPEKKITVVENGVNTELFCSDSEPSEDARTDTVCYVGGLQPWQGIERMVDVISLADREIQFYIVGGTESRQNEIQQYVEEVGLEGQVTLVGRVEHSKVPSYINKADLCFGPFNKHRQASPMKIYEYLACGKRVMLLNDTGLEFVEGYPGVDRFSFETSNEEIADYLIQLLSENDANHAGREYVVQNHSWVNTVSRIQQQIEQTC